MAISANKGDISRPHATRCSASNIEVRAKEWIFNFLATSCMRMTAFKTKLCETWHMTKSHSYQHHLDTWHLGQNVTDRTGETHPVMLSCHINQLCSSRPIRQDVMSCHDMMSYYYMSCQFMAFKVSCDVLSCYVMSLVMLWFYVICEMTYRHEIWHKFYADTSCR